MNKKLKATIINLVRRGFLHYYVNRHDGTVVVSFANEGAHYTAIWRIIFYTHDSVDVAYDAPGNKKQLTPRLQLSSVVCNNTWGHPGLKELDSVQEEMESLLDEDVEMYFASAYDVDYVSVSFGEEHMYIEVREEPDEGDLTHRSLRNV